MRFSLPVYVRWLILPVVLILAVMAQVLFQKHYGEEPQPPPAPPGMAVLEAQAGVWALPVVDVLEVPVAAAWSYPMGTEGGGFVYNAQPFGAENAFRGGAHLGEDYNGIGQENSDLGDPVFAVADGRVVYAGVPSPGWGGVVMLAHRLPDGRLVQSFYGHLDPEKLRGGPGQKVARGRQIGVIAIPEALGAVDYAHLHFEMREGGVVGAGPGYTLPAWGEMGRLNAEVFLREHAAEVGIPSLEGVESVEGVGRARFELGE